MNRDVTYWPAHPRKGSVKLKPKYVRARHMSRDDQKAQEAFIGCTAQLMYGTSTQSRASIRQERAGE